MSISFELSPSDRRNLHDLLARQMLELSSYRIVGDYNPEALLSKLISISPNKDSLLLVIKKEIELMQRVKKKIEEAVTWWEKLKVPYPTLKANMKKRLPHHQDLYNRLVHIAELPPDFERSNAMADSILQVRIDLEALIKSMQGNRNNGQQAAPTAISTQVHQVLPVASSTTSNSGRGSSASVSTSLMLATSQSQLAAINAAKELEKEQHVEQQIHKHFRQLGTQLDVIKAGTLRLEEVFRTSFTTSDWNQLNANMLGELKVFIVDIASEYAEYRQELKRAYDFVTAHSAIVAKKSGKRTRVSDFVDRAVTVVVAYAQEITLDISRLLSRTTTTTMSMSAIKSTGGSSEIPVVVSSMVESCQKYNSDNESDGDNDDHMKQITTRNASKEMNVLCPEELVNKVTALVTMIHEHIACSVFYQHIHQLKPPQETHDRTTVLPGQETGFDSSGHQLPAKRLKT